MNLEDSLKILKDTPPLGIYKSVAQKVNPTSPLHSLRKSEKNGCKLDYMLIKRIFTSPWNLKDSSQHQKIPASESMPHGSATLQ